MKQRTSPGLEVGREPALPVALLDRGGVVVEPREPIDVGIGAEVPVVEGLVAVAPLEDHQRTLLTGDATERIQLENSRSVPRFM